MRQNCRTRYEAGLCIMATCGKPRDGTSPMCKEHNEQKKCKARERYARRKAAGLCATCKKRATPGFSRCRECLDRNIEEALKHYHDCIARGVCPLCPRANPKPHCAGSKVYCEAHWQKVRKEDTRRRRQTRPRIRHTSPAVLAEASTPHEEGMYPEYPTGYLNQPGFALPGQWDERLFQRR
jgi:hypothetical protein